VDLSKGCSVGFDPLRTFFSWYPVCRSAIVLVSALNRTAKTVEGFMLYSCATLAGIIKASDFPFLDPTR
jgi:hypothetical protein